MTTEQFEKAKPIIETLRNLKRVKKDFETFFENEPFQDKGLHCADRMKHSQYDLIISKYLDRSGFHFNLEGCYVAEAILRTSQKIVNEEIERLEKELEKI